MEKDKSMLHHSNYYTKKHNTFYGKSKSKKYKKKTNIKSNKKSSKKCTKKSISCPPNYINSGKGTLDNTVCINKRQHNQFPSKVLMNKKGLYAHEFDNNKPFDFCISKKVGNYITCALTSNKKGELISKNIQIVPVLI